MRTSEKYLVLLDYCLAHGRISVGEAAELLQTTRRTVLRMFHFIESIKHELYAKLRIFT
jgi:predicted DNA-binding transcriptional regulator YafY